MESTITAQLATSSSNLIETNQYLTINYWILTPRAGSLNHWGLALLAAVSTLILIGGLSLLAYNLLNSGFSSTKRRFFNKVVWWITPFGVLGWLLVLSRLYGIVFFSARFWWVVWLVCLLASLIYLWREYKKIPSKELAVQTYQLKKRYFPKKKR